MSQRARAHWGEGLASVDLEVAFTPPPGMPRASDMVSGGTFQSMAVVASADGAASIADPAVLIDEPALAAAVRRLSPIAIAPRSGPDGAVIAPMTPAAFINPAVIHRSEALLASAEGRPPEPFRFRK